MLIAEAAAQTPAPAAATDNSGALAVLVLVAAALAWIGLRMLIRRLRAGRTERVVHGAFNEYALAALVNAAKLDGRVAEAERAAILAAMREIAGADYQATALAAGFAGPALSKDELVAYLAMRAAKFDHRQKTALLRALLNVFVADGRFDESEHHALIEYTAAIGFDRKTAPQRLRGLVDAMVRDSIT
jgi:uncharacterized membrane protein YebE (DUF533 family)